MQPPKMLRDYNDKYQFVPEDDIGRIDYLLKDTNLRKQKTDLMNEVHRIHNIKWKEFRFTIFLLPKSTPRPRYSPRGQMFYVKGAGDNKKLFQQAMLHTEFDMITTPMEFYCTSYLPIPSAMNKVDKLLAELGFIRPISKPDFDNLAKTYADMIQGIIMSDDALIIKGVSEKYYSCKPRIEIKIRYMETFDCVYNKNKLERR